MIKNCLKQKIEVCIEGDYLREITFFQNFSFDQPRQHIKKQRHYFVNKGTSSQAMVFPVVMYGCESWTVKKAEC